MKKIKYATIFLLSFFLCSCLKNEPAQDTLLMSIDKFEKYFSDVTAEYKDILFTEIDSLVIGYQTIQSVNSVVTDVIAGMDDLPQFDTNIMNYIQALVTGNFSFFATACPQVPHGIINIDARTGEGVFTPFEPTPDAGKLVLNVVTGTDSTYTAIIEANNLFHICVDTTDVILAKNISIILKQKKGPNAKEETYMDMDYHMEFDQELQNACAQAVFDISGNRHFEINADVDDTKLVFNISNNIEGTQLFNAKYVMVGRDMYASMLSQDIAPKVLVRHLQVNCFDQKILFDIDIDNIFDKINPNKDKITSILLQFFMQGAGNWRGTTSSVLDSSFGAAGFVDLFNNLNIMISTPVGMGYSNPVARVKLTTEYSDEDYAITYVVCNDYSSKPISEIPLFGYNDIYEFSADVMVKVIDIILNQ